MRVLSTVAVLALLAGPAMAADKPTKETAQVKSDLYVTAVEAHELMTQNDRAVLIDVRDPVEIMFTGWTPETDFHVPYKIIDSGTWNPDGTKLQGRVNPDFADQVEARLKDMGAAKDDPIIFMCRSGSTRSAPAADLLHDRGWTQTYTVVDGFEGGKRKEGPSKGVRDVNGWRNAGLPWGYKMEADKITLIDNGS